MAVRLRHSTVLSYNKTTFEPCVLFLLHILQLHGLKCTDQIYDLISFFTLIRKKSEHFTVLGSACNFHNMTAKYCVISFKFQMICRGCFGACFLWFAAQPGELLLSRTVSRPPYRLIIVNRNIDRSLKFLK